MNTKQLKFKYAICRFLDKVMLKRFNRDLSSGYDYIQC